VGKPFTLLAAAPTVHVTVTRTVAGGAQLGAKLKGKELVFANGTAHAVVGTGQTNRLEWVVVGPAGATYTITVTEPIGTGCDDGATLDESGRDAGSCTFAT